jgi:hypothetical protein
LAIKVRILTYTTYEGGTLMVVDEGGASWEDAYHWDSPGYTPPPYNPPPYVPTVIYSVPTQIVPEYTPIDYRPKAWWLQADLQRGFLFPPDRLGSFTIEWPHPQSNMFRLNDSHILLREDAAYAPDSVQHEMGHAVMFYLYNGYWPPANCPIDHKIREAYNPVCAWTEGWAIFWALVVNNDPFYEWANGRYESLESTLLWTALGDQVEGHVAATLWDLVDTPNDGYDTYTGDFADAWAVFSAQPYDTMAEFWAAWKASYGPRTMRTHEGVRCLYQNTINYNSPPTLSGLPDVTLNVNTSRYSAIDLWAYTSDEESGGYNVVYTLYISSSKCGIAVNAADYVDVFPAANWAGSCAATIVASDTLATAQDSFQVLVVDNVPPSPPGNLRSPSTRSNGWTPAAATMAWNPAADVGGGIDGYSLAWDTCAPDQVKDVEENVTTASKQVLTSGPHNFAVRAVDTWGNWGNPACAQIQVDAANPMSSVIPLPGEQTHNWWLVAWSGSDEHSGIAHYDVQYRVGLDGPWTDWRVDTASTQGLFTHATPGQFYSFRCRAVDKVGNVEDWPALGAAAGTLAGADTSGLTELCLPIVRRN